MSHTPSSHAFHRRNEQSSITTQLVHGVTLGWLLQHFPGHGREQLLRPSWGLVRLCYEIKIDCDKFNHSYEQSYDRAIAILKTNRANLFIHYKKFISTRSELSLYVFIDREGIKCPKDHIGSTIE